VRANDEVKVTTLAPIPPSNVGGEQRYERELQKETNWRVKNGSTHANGKMTAHPSPVTLHSNGTSLVERTIIPAMMANERRSGNQNLQRFESLVSPVFQVVIERSQK